MFNLSISRREIIPILERALRHLVNIHVDYSLTFRLLIKCASLLNHSPHFDGITGMLTFSMEYNDTNRLYRLGLV